MEAKRSKYDTNPLDEEVSAHADSSFGAAPARSTRETEAELTREVGRTTHQPASSESEAPTRRIDDGIVTSYPSILVPKRGAATYQPPRAPFADIYQPPAAAPPSVYQPPPVPVTYVQGANKVSGLGIPEKWAVTMPYMPFYLAILVAIVTLVLVPRTETRTRFHASQALAIQLGITVINTLLTFGGVFSGRYTGAGLFTLASSILLVIAMIRVWKGKPVVISPLDEPRKWLDEKIKPRK